MAALSFIRPYQHLTHILTWAPKLYSTNCWICLFAVFLAEKLVGVFSWNMKNHMSVNIVLVTRWLQQSRNEEKSYLCNQKKKNKERIGKIYQYIPRCTKSKSSAEVQWMLLLYFKFYFRTILKKTCKHPLFYICNLYRVSVVANCYLGA